MSLDQTCSSDPAAESHSAYERPCPPQTDPTNPHGMSPQMFSLLRKNTYYPGKNAKYPYILIQLSENSERAFEDALVSDAVIDFVQNHHITHVIVQTHGWNTTPDKAVGIAFTEFMSGMQDDRAMPPYSPQFSPLFLAFIWPAVPISFATEEDALTKAQLLADNEQANEQNPHILRVCHAAQQAIQKEDPDDEELLTALQKITVDSLDDDHHHHTQDAEAIVTEERETAKASHTHKLDRGLTNIFTLILRPFENLMFGRLKQRAIRVGKVMGFVLGKILQAGQTRYKVSLMANSLGVQVLCGILNHPEQLPYKIHTVFFVQGAIATILFQQGEKFQNVHNTIAGPALCTFSKKDRLLQNMFRWFHGPAIGYDGTCRGVTLSMKKLDQIEQDPYLFENGIWNDIDGTDFIDEGGFFDGGHGDFKEDETTSLYWAAIKRDVEDSAYDLST